MYKYDIAKQITGLEDANPGDARYISPVVFGGYYSRSTNSYHFVITGYVQDLIDGRITDYGTYLAPVDTTSKSSVDIGPTTQAAGRLVAVGTPAKSSPNYPNRIKLNIIYTNRPHVEAFFYLDCFTCLLPGVPTIRRLGFVLNTNRPPTRTSQFQNSSSSNTGQ